MVWRPDHASGQSGRSDLRTGAGQNAATPPSLRGSAAPSIMPPG